MYLIERSGCYPFAFIAHPKTGSSAFRTAFKPLEPSAPATHHRVCPITVQEVRAARGKIAATVRNPFDTCASWWFYQEQNVMEKAGRPIRPFDEWIEMVLGDNEDGGTAQRWIRRGLHYGLPHCTDVFRFEEPLEPQLNAVLESLGIPPVTVEVQNATQRLPYREVYSARSRRLIQQKFQRDLDDLGYSY